jgi:hypothetical protein
MMMVMSDDEMSRVFFLSACSITSYHVRITRITDSDFFPFPPGAGIMKRETKPAGHDLPAGCGIGRGERIRSVRRMIHFFFSTLSAVTISSPTG